MNSRLGKFITLEGTEGVGKSSNLSFIEGYLRERGVNVVVTREPGGTPLAEDIREIILAARDEPMSHLTELLLVFAARAQHLEALIKPNLEAGNWVLSDRFTDATYAYQGHGRGLPIDVIKMLEELVQRDLRPDHTFILDVDVETGLSRASNRGALDRIELEQVDFFERVRDGYKSLAARHPERYSLIDAAPALEKVQASIKQSLNELLGVD
ncbi:dTMP kinase [Aurantivibrio plasticivorans]